MVSFSEAEPGVRVMPNYDFHFSSDIVGVYVTTTSIPKALEILKNIVKDPSMFELADIIDSNGRNVKPEDVR